jgi:hypothetical protein
MLERLMNSSDASKTSTRDQCVLLGCNDWCHKCKSGKESRRHCSDRRGESTIQSAGFANPADRNRYHDAVDGDITLQLMAINILSKLVLQVSHYVQ